MIGRAIGFINLIKELSLKHIKEEAERRFLILLAGGTEADRSLIRRALAGDDAKAQSLIVDWDLGAGAPRPEQAIAIVYLIDDNESIERDRGALVKLARHGTGIVAVERQRTADPRIMWELMDASGRCVPARLTNLDEAGVHRELVPAVVNAAEGYDLPLGRFLPGMREYVAGKIITSTSRGNAEFAALSNIPALIPIIGNLFAAGADFLVLTKNQLILMYKVAAIYGRDLDQKTQLYAQMLPAVGAALVWRTVARELVALLPEPIGALPKVLIAYAGTFSVGRGAQYYFEHGRVPSRDTLRSYYQDAMRRVGSQSVWRRDGYAESDARQFGNPE